MLWLRSVRSADRGYGAAALEGGAGVGGAFDVDGDLGSGVHVCPGRQVVRNVRGVHVVLCTNRAMRRSMPLSRCVYRQVAPRNFPRRMREYYTTVCFVGIVLQSQFTAVSWRVQNNINHSPSGTP